MTLQQVLDPGRRYAFLAGAGASFDSPSNLPLANQIVYGLLDTLNIDEAHRSEFKQKFDRGELRFEQFIEQLISCYSDPTLNIFDTLAVCQSPNRIHHFLASAIAGGHPVFTTNFDNLIEQAGQRSSCLIRSVYDEHSAGQTDRTANPLYKLHGTLLDEKGNDCRESVIGLISRIGKNGEAFAFAPVFKSILTEAIQQYPLIILGYSGSDDFDIIPTLAQINRPRQLIWIDHSNTREDLQVMQSAQWEKFPAHVRRVLDELVSFGFWTRDMFTVLTGNTSAIAVEIGKILLPDAPDYMPGLSHQFPDYYFEDWKYEHALEAWRDHFFIANVYRSLGEYFKAIPFLQKALQMATDLSETGIQLHLHLALSEINLRIKDLKTAKVHIDQVAQLITVMDPASLKDIPQLLHEYRAIYYTENNELSEAEALLQSSIPSQDDLTYAGYLYALSEVQSKKGDHEQTRALLEQALQIYRRNGSLDSIVYCLSNLAREDAEAGAYRQSLNAILEASRICSLTHNFALLAKCHESRARLYGKLGLLGKAFEDLAAAMQLYEIKLDASREKALCLATMASVLDRAETIRSQFPHSRNIKISAHFIEGLGTYYGPSDMPGLQSDSTSLTDGYILSAGRKFTSLAAFPSGLFSSPPASSPLLVLEDEFPEELYESKTFALRAVALAKEIGSQDLLEAVLKIIARDAGQGGC